MDNRPIGVFDSGLGGLTVLKEIMELLPAESIVYFGDSGRAPYGTKSSETVTKYAFQNIRFLLGQDIKLIVIACNTASAYSYNMIKNSFDIPTIEVVEPGAVTAVRETLNKKIGVIATPATVNSGAYEKAIRDIDNSIEIFSKACPLFVQLVEEGWWENDIALMIAEEYLGTLKYKGIDTLVLGCTHYPLLQKTISKVMGDGVKLVSSAMEAANAVKRIVTERQIERNAELKPLYSYYTSDSVDKFVSLGGIILNSTIKSASKVDIEKY